jgi:anthranilate synthase component I
MLIAESRIEVAEDLPPMAAGLFGYIGYDMVRLMERLPAPNPDPLGLPDAILVRPTIMAIFDSVKDEVTVVTPVYPDADVSAKAAYARASERLCDVIDAFDRPLDLLAHSAPEAPPIGAPRSNTAPEDYMAMVGRAKDYIAAGDIFQVVLSQRFETEFTLPPFALYRALRRVNPSPFLYYLDFDRFSIIGSSPEILVRVRDGKVTLRPIAGTRRRGATRGGGPGARRRVARRPQGARRTPHAARSRAQRRRPGGRDRQRQRDREVQPGILQPGHPHRLQRRGQARSAP